MAAGWQLRELVSGLRAETGKSTNVALGVNEREALATRLRMTQELLVTQYDWPFLSTDRDVPLLVGERLYAFPADMTFDGVQSVKVRTGPGNSWLPVCYGIGSDQYNMLDTEAGATSWPVSHWRVADDAIEVWPTPDRNCTLRLSGKRAVRPLREDADVCELDGNMLVLFAAADVLGRQGSEDAQLALAKAQKLLRSILVRQDSDKSRPFVIGGPVPAGPRGQARSTIRAPR